MHSPFLSTSDLVEVEYNFVCVDDNVPQLQRHRVVLGELLN